MRPSSQRSPHFQKLEEDVQQYVYYLPHLILLQHPANFNFCDGCAAMLAYTNLSGLLKRDHFGGLALFTLTITYHPKSTKTLKLWLML